MNVSTPQGPSVFSCSPTMCCYRLLRLEHPTFVVFLSKFVFVRRENFKFRFDVWYQTEIMIQFLLNLINLNHSYNFQSLTICPNKRNPNDFRCLGNNSVNYGCIFVCIKYNLHNHESPILFLSWLPLRTPTADRVINQEKFCKKKYSGVEMLSLITNKVVVDYYN